MLQRLGVDAIGLGVLGVHQPDGSLRQLVVLEDPRVLARAVAVVDRVLRALAAFGAPTAQLTARDLSDTRTVFQIGFPPRRVDLVSSIDGVDFADAWPHRETMHLDKLEVPVIGLKPMQANKRATGRLQDQADAGVIRALLRALLKKHT
jgi:hypothetical protein